MKFTSPVRVRVRVRVRGAVAVTAVVLLLGLILLQADAFSIPPTKTSSSALSMTTKTLYGHPGTRSPLVNWAAYEVGVDLVMGDLQQNPHPFGQIPCLTDNDGDVIVFESGAILQYLHEESKANQGLTPSEAAAVTSWITWANASLDPICFLETPEGKVYDTGLKKPNKRLSQLDALLLKSATKTEDSANYFLVGSKFTVADVAVASYLLYVLQFFPGTADAIGSQWPTMKQYMYDCASREGYGKAFGEGVQANLMKQLQASSSTDKKKLFGMF
jgi:glutathione S-transferase